MYVRMYTHVDVLHLTVSCSSSEAAAVVTLSIVYHSYDSIQMAGAGNR